MNTFLLWENEKYEIVTPVNPHIPYSEGLHIIVSPKDEFPNAWTNIDCSTKAFELASKACKVIEDLNMAIWFNIQANGNWGLLPGATPFFHVHVYSRNETDSWGKPIVLPVAPRTYQNNPMPEEDQVKLKEAFIKNL